MNRLYIEHSFIIFTLYSFCGWVLETVFKSIRNKRFFYSGFLFGPFCPIYGFGALLILESKSIFKNTFTFSPLYSFLLTLGMAIILTSLLEYFTAFLLETLFSYMWWDYSDSFLNIKGRICLKYSIIWGVVSLIFLNYIHPFCIEIINKIPFSWTYSLTIFIIFYFSLDTLMSIESVLNIRIWNSKIGSNIAIFNIEEYKQCVSELIVHQSVQEMKKYKHHSSITCYKHCIHVSLYSYLLCKILFLDYKSAARGGLLHDLFLYDWKTTKLDEGWHGFEHPKIALNNAINYFELNDIEKDAIIKHMFPLTICPPKFMESIIVCIVDKICAQVEIFGFCSNKLMNKYLKEFL